MQMSVKGNMYVYVCACPPVPPHLGSRPLGYPLPRYAHPPVETDDFMTSFSLSELSPLHLVTSICSPTPQGGHMGAIIPPC